MRLLPPLFLLLVACGPTPDFTSKLGSENFDTAGKLTPFSMGWADLLEGDLVTRLSGYGFDAEASQRAFQGLQVHWLDVVFDCPYMTADGEWKTGKCGGDELNGYARVVAETRCPWQTSYQHELTHRVHEANGMPIDYMHARPEWKSLFQVTCDGTELRPAGE